MSRLFVFLSLLSIFYVSCYCSEQFNEKYLECYLKTRKLEEMVTSPEMIGSAVSTLSDQCYSIQECYKQLTHVETFEKNQTEFAENMEDLVRKACKLFHKGTHKYMERFNSQPKIVQCLANVRADEENHISYLFFRPCSKFGT